MASLAGNLAGGNVRYAATSAPAFTSITPDHGTALGGTSVVIVGTTLNAVKQVIIGGVACTGIVHTNDTHITCIVPQGSVGDSDILLRSRGGSDTEVDGYTYDSSVTCTSVTADTGPAAGGTAVTVAGTGFTNATSVKFGGVAATSVVIVSDISITCVTPAHAAGAVDVVVDAGTLGSGTAAGGFTYT